MRQPHRQHVGRMIQQDRLPDVGRADDVSAAPGIERRHMPLLALRCSDGHQLLGGRKRFFGLALQRRRAEQLHEIALGAMRHKHFRVGVEHFLEPIAGVRPDTQVMQHHAVIPRNRLLAGGRHLQTVLVAKHAQRSVADVAGTVIRSLGATQAPEENPVTRPAPCLGPIAPRAAA